MKWVASISRDYWIYLDITCQSFKIWEFWGEFWGIETFHRSKFSPATGVSNTNFAPACSCRYPDHASVTSMGEVHHDRTQKLEGCYNMRHTIINHKRFWGRSTPWQNTETWRMLQHEAHNHQPRTLLGEPLSSQDSRNVAAHYVVDMHDAQVRLISRDAKVYKPKSTNKTCSSALRRRHVWCQVRSLAETPKSTNKKDSW